jgi:hypothetical protein
VIDQARSHASDYAIQAQSLFDRFIEDKRLVSKSEVPDVSADSMAIPARDEERDRLQMKNRELEQDRRKLTEAAIKLGKERAVLEVRAQKPSSFMFYSRSVQEQRLQFLEAQRGWEVQRILADLPPTSKLPPPLSISKNKVKFRSSSSPARRKSRTPAKGIAAKNTVTRKSSFASPGRKSSNRKAALRLLKRKSIIHTLETEVITLPPPSPPPPSKETIAKMTSTENLLASCSQGPKQLVLPTEFVLPPPSPQALLPALPKSASENYTLDPQTSPDSSTFSDSVNVPLLQTRYALPSTSTQLIATIPSSSSNIYNHVQPPPQTPGVRPCPSQKPIAARMVHAYSPVKPSPLSRILMMADNSPPFNSANDEDLMVPPPPLRSMPMIKPSLDSMTEKGRGTLTGNSCGGVGSRRELAFEEVGVSMSVGQDENMGRTAPMSIDDLQGDAPLREKNARRSPSPKKTSPTKRPPVSNATRPKLRPDAETRASLATKDKGKGKEAEIRTVTGRTRTAAVAGLDKENNAAKRLKPSPPTTTSSTAGSKKRPAGSNSRKVPLPPPPGARARSSASRPAKGKAGPPRRVPIGSSEAASGS